MSLVVHKFAKVLHLDSGTCFEGITVFYTPDILKSFLLARGMPKDAQMSLFPRLHF